MFTIFEGVFFAGAFHGETSLRRWFWGGENGQPRSLVATEVGNKEIN